MEPLITEADAAAVHAYLVSGGWLTEYRQTRLFEQLICEYTGARYCLTTPSGTLALFLALSASGVGRGDDVLVPDLTMVASATAVLLAGANVRFVDVEPGTFCLDLTAAERAMTERTGAVILVSLNGRAPGGVEAFVEGCRRRGVTVIEDAAQSLGSFVAGRHLGTIGDCGCFSFSSQKLVTTGQGGAVVTDDELTYERMQALRDFGRRGAGSDHYLTVGWNLKFTDLQAVVGIEQLRRLPALVARKKELFGLYREQLDEIEAVVVPETDLEAVTPWFIDVLVPGEIRTSLAAHLRARGIGSRPFYPALHAEPAFGIDGAFPVACGISERGLWLPSSLRLSDQEVERICRAIRDFFG